MAQVRATAEELLPLVYQELRRIASLQMNRERAGLTLQTTALVHEAFLKLAGGCGSAPTEWENQEHFLRAASKAMQRVLVDCARARKSAKRGGAWIRRPLDEVDVPIAELDIPDFLPELESALEKLEHLDPTAAEIVQLRYFAGMTIDQAAATLGISPRSANRCWNFARAWLYDALRESDLQNF
jgi:RNA polymerase sigma factor (TIGR02999 family)